LPPCVRCIGFPYYSMKEYNFQMEFVNIPFVL